MVKLENYFDYLSNDDIRIKGTRIGIETVLDDYFDGASPEEISVRYKTLTLEQVYATITYYLNNRERIDGYMDQWRQNSDRVRRIQNESPPAIIQRLRRIKEAGGKTERSLAS